MRISEILVEFCEAIDKPAEWPQWLRRLFVITLPVSAPLWLALCGLYLLCLLAGLIILAPIAAIMTMWYGKHKPGKSS